MTQRGQWRMNWVYRIFCLSCFAGYWISYSHAIPYWLPVTGFAVFALAAGLPEAAVTVFLFSYPVLLYFNQYPEQHFSAPTFLVIALALGLSFRKSAHLRVPLIVVALYFSLSAVRYRPDQLSVLQGIWTTNQTSPTLFVGICVMWIAGIMLFDFFRG